MPRIGAALLVAIALCEGCAATPLGPTSVTDENDRPATSPLRPCEVRAAVRTGLVDGQDINPNRVTWNARLTCEGRTVYGRMARIRFGVERS